MALVFNTNLSPASPAEGIFQTKALLKTATWVVKASSDGTTLNAAGDQITTAVTGAGGMDNNRAWFRIQSPAGAGGREFIFQRSTTTNTDWRIKYSAGAGFSGGAQSATQVPSATDEQIVVGGGIDASPTFTTAWAISSSFRWSAVADNAAPYAWWASGFVNAGGIPGASNIPAAFYFDPIVSTTGNAGDTDQAVVYASGAANIASLLQNFSNAFGWFRKGLTSPAWANYPALTFQTIAGNQVFPAGAEVADIITAKENLMPVMYYHLTSSLIDTVKGVSTLFRYAGLAHNLGDTYTVSTARDKIIIGNLALPWDGSLPTV